MARPHGSVDALTRRFDLHMHEVGCVTVDVESAMVYEHGWQSWSPSGCYPLGTRPQRPSTENSRVMNWRQEKQPAAEAFWGEGLMP